MGAALPPPWQRAGFLPLAQVVAAVAYPCWYVYVCAPEPFSLTYLVTMVVPPTAFTFLVAAGFVVPTSARERRLRRFGLTVALIGLAASVLLLPLLLTGFFLD